MTKKEVPSQQDYLAAAEKSEQSNIEFINQHGHNCSEQILASSFNRLTEAKIKTAEWKMKINFSDENKQNYINATNLYRPDGKLAFACEILSKHRQSYQDNESMDNLKAILSWTRVVGLLAIQWLELHQQLPKSIHV